ncbi:AbrB/MazE/SpoVT family DNA-binding domain-containing protein [Methanosarcina sp. MSH10X1]|nr:AbrB/MazE/SpoVT family DNA-binding domain-containing protein [Methanosarcina sp. MSH10X1]RXA21836.1 AbrB/MazE/SpoVT family DNA-binding domain-containing protein [Methanosarcina sp. MSH10X1]
MIDGDLFIVIPENFVKPLKWHKGDTVDIELIENSILMSKIDFN